MAYLLKKEITSLKDRAPASPDKDQGRATLSRGSGNRKQPDIIGPVDPDGSAASFGRNVPRGKVQRASREEFQRKALKHISTGTARCHMRTRAHWQNEVLASSRRLNNDEADHAVSHVGIRLAGFGRGDPVCDLIAATSAMRFRRAASHTISPSSTWSIMPANAAAPSAQAFAMTQSWHHLHPPRLPVLAASALVVTSGGDLA